MTNEGICAVLLAGGKSSRMGFNKALLNIGNRPLIAILADRLRQVTPHIVISSNDATSYAFLDLPVIPDQFTGQGPLAGIHAAMSRSASPLFLVLACDLPNLPETILHHLVSVIEDYDSAIPRSLNGPAHPLCAAYRRTCLPFIEKALQQGANSVIHTILEAPLRIRWVDPAEGRFKDIDLANLNTPEDLQRLWPQKSPCPHTPNI